MTHRWINVGFLLLILGIGTGYLWLSRDLAVTRLGSDLRPIMFPVGLGIGVVVLCLVEMVRAFRDDDPEASAAFKIEGLGRLIATIVLMAVFFLVWQMFGLFYPGAAALVFALILLYRERPNRRDVAIALAVALTFTLIVYLVFQVSFGISFIH